MTDLLDPPTTTPGPADVVAPAPRKTRTFRIFRFRRGDRTPRWDHFEIPVESDRTTVLDALTWIRAQLDPSLAIRHSCFHASCGTCGMRVNGRDVLACVTKLDDLASGQVTVEPLLNQPLVSDLVVDIEAPYEAFDAVSMPLIRESELVPGGQPAPGVPSLGRYEDCIECGICVSACPIAASDGAYAGPGVLAAAWRIVEEPRGADPQRALRLVDDEHGVWRCHMAFECSEACPSGGLPAEKIMQLRRGLLRHRLRAAFGRHRATTGRGA